MDRNTGREPPEWNRQGPWRSWELWRPCGAGSSGGLEAWGQLGGIRSPPGLDTETGQESPPGPFITIFYFYNNL